ncbi:thiamine/thiamine pyrophosphate ABC transporter permease ThiP [Pasteurellaceae bacterium Macca]|nr:thiamine/thiamine pyrophosphate ABC transporter permease ThiP [Pasteurellaceae bacterium Macca]
MFSQGGKLRFLTRLMAWGIYFSIIGLYGFSLWAIFSHQGEESQWTLAQSLPILQQSLFQAGLSSILATLLGVLLARSLFYLRFIGQGALTKLFSFVWALPSLVVIFALIGVWGNSGWVKQLALMMGLDWDYSLYGLQGILFAHLFLNVPLVAKYYLEGLCLIPSSQHKLATQLHLQGWAFFHIVELPVFKRVVPSAFTAVFLLCFTSFPIVLILGGGPKYSTLEVAIYQAVTFEFDFAKAVMLILLQLAIGVVLQLLMQRVVNRQRPSTTALPVAEIWRGNVTGWRKYGLQAVLFVGCFAIFLPLANVVWQGISVPNLAEKLHSPILWQASLYSLLLSLMSGVIVVAIAYLLALEARRLAYRQQKGYLNILVGVSIYPLILPVFMLAVGLFLLLMDVELSTGQLLTLLAVCNALILLPYIYRILSVPLLEIYLTQDKLARSLGLKGWQRWRIAEMHYLLHPLRNAFALAMSASLGNFSLIAFFGTPDFATLPFLLYQQLGSYRIDDASLTALFLLLFAWLPVLWIDQYDSLKS